MPPGKIEWIEPNKVLRLSLLSKKTGETHNRDGLNWGQRPGRNPDQAVIPIRGEARREGFLPDRGFTFSLLTDDGYSMDCTVQQDGRKAVSTTKNNSEIGQYFRKRLGIEKGEFVTRQHLENYGRSDVIIKKIDDETFMLDFSKI